MPSDEELFEQRVTLLGQRGALATHSPAATIVDPRSLSATVEASTLDGALALERPLPRISVDLQPPVETGGASLARAPDLALVRTIGEGGMGRVHLARQHSLGRDVAVKTLKENATALASVGLLREARLTGSLEHPGVIPVHALGVDDAGGPLLVMKRVEGVDWATLLEDPNHSLWSVLATTTGDRLAANLEILAQVCRTVEFSHSRGIIHRDIKPENVMVGTYGEVYLVDWGVATTKRSTPTQEGVVGTPAYMAPEMVLGSWLDERSDVYLLGATLHQALTGTLRHDGLTMPEVLRSALLSTPVAYSSAVPEHLAALCNDAMARDPAMRPENARVFRERIAEFLQQRSALALSDAATERLAALQTSFDETTAAAPPKDLARAYRLAIEARFGFTESARAYPKSTAAAAGVRASALALVELELRQGHADTAAALLREVEDADPALADRIAVIRAKDDERLRDAKRLEAIDRDLDPDLEAASRAYFLVAMVILVALITVTLFVTEQSPTPLNVVYMALVSIAGMGAGVLVARKQVLANAYNRRLTAIMSSTLLLFLGERLVGLLSSTPVERTLAGNLWILTAAVVVSAITVDRRIWLVMPALCAGIGLMAAWPERAVAVFGLTLGSSCALLLVVLWPRRGVRRTPR